MMSVSDDSAVRGNRRRLKAGDYILIFFFLTIMASCEPDLSMALPYTLKRT